MNEQDHLDGLRGSAVGLLRARINQLINSLGIGLSDTSAQLISWAILALLGLNLLFVLNLAIGFLLGQLFDSTGLGFLALVGLYAVVTLIYLLMRSRLERRVQARVARRVHLATDNINTNLNQITALRVEHPYREAFISGEPSPYQALTLRRDEAKRQAQRASGDLREGVEYIRHNYGKIFGYMAQNKIPTYGYIAPLVGLMGGNKKAKPAMPTAEPRKPQAVDFLERKVAGIKPYVPYLITAYNFLSPVVSSFIIGKSQSWLLGKLLGTKKRKR